ncbi:hypothetical protein HAX54_025310 [Datura stramonium]|uniref:Uncharacterized protein n=1 Tax=Datura stramonium TaxID=4076 RepID=A0ABS8UZB5_DATST|nr:hypothetical protein [Datura stramonium]
MMAAMFQQAMESLVEKIQTQPQVNMMSGENNGYNQSDEPLRRGPSQISSSINGAPTNSAAYTARDNYGPVGRGVGNKSTSDRGSGAVGRGQFQVFALNR